MGSKKKPKQSDEMFTLTKQNMASADAAAKKIDPVFSTKVRDKAMADYDAMNKPGVDIRQFIDGAEFLTPEAIAAQRARIGSNPTALLAKNAGNPGVDAYSVALDKEIENDNARNYARTMTQAFLDKKANALQTGLAAEGQQTDAFLGKAGIYNSAAGNAGQTFLGVRQIEKQPGKWGRFLSSAMSGGAQVAAAAL